MARNYYLLANDVVENAPAQSIYTIKEKKFFLNQMFL